MRLNDPYQTRAPSSADHPLEAAPDNDRGRPYSFARAPRPERGRVAAGPGNSLRHAGWSRHSIARSVRGAQSLQLPVEVFGDDQTGGLCTAYLPIHHEKPVVRCDVVGPVVGIPSETVGKQHRLGSLNELCTRRNLNRHEIVGAADVEDLISPVRPQRLDAAGPGDTGRRVRVVGEASHVDLVLARLVRHVGHPLSRGREGQRPLIGRSGDERAQCGIRRRSPEQVSVLGPDANRPGPSGRRG